MKQMLRPFLAVMLVLVLSALLYSAPAKATGFELADLAVTLTDGVTTAAPGGSVTYTLAVSNAGPSNAAGATVVSFLPPTLTGITWTGVGAGGGTCTASGSGNINDAVNLPAGGSVIYTITATVDPAATWNFFTAAAVSSMVADPNLINNSATDMDTLSLTGTVSIGGDAYLGSILTASLSGTNNTGTLTWQWARDHADIPGAANAQYTLTAEDIGRMIGVRVTSSVEAGSLNGGPVGPVAVPMSQGTLTDDFYDVEVTADGLFAQGAALIVEPIGETDPLWLAMAVYLTGRDAFAAYEIHIEPDYGYELPITLAIPVPAKYEGLPILILHRKADGDAEQFTPTVHQGKAVISVTEFSPFILTGEPGVSITQQPEDAVATVGNKALFRVDAIGYSLTYQWQRSTDGGGSWADIPNANDTEYETASVIKGNNGYQYRVVVRDGYGDSVTSDTALLTVTTAPVTGDTSRPVLYALIMVFLSAGAALLLKTRKRNAREE